MEMTSYVSVPKMSGVRQASQFEAYFHSVRLRALRHARMLTGNDADAEDLVQTTLVKAWQGYEAYDSDRSFITWFYTIMRHAFVDQCRAGKRRIRSMSWAEALAPDQAEQERDVADPKTELAEFLTHHVREEALRKALGRLPEPQRRAVIMCDVLEMNYDECAAAEGVPVGTVRSRLSRARRHLRQVLSVEAGLRGTNL